VVTSAIVSVSYVFINDSLHDMVSVLYTGVLFNVDVAAEVSQ